MSGAHLSDPQDPGRAARPPVPRAIDGVLAVSRLVATSAQQAGPARVNESLVAEARRLVHASAAGLFAFTDEGRRLRGTAGDVVGRLSVGDHPALGALLGQPHQSVVVEAAEAEALGRNLMRVDAIGSVVLIAIPTVGPTHLLALGHPAVAAFSPEAVAAAEALAAAGGDALARRHEADEVARRLEGHRALTRAAKTLNESLDLATVLRRISHEANRILDGDYTAVYRGARDGVVIEAATGVPPEMLGFRLAPGEGLSGRVRTTERSMLTNDYAALAAPPASSFFFGVRSCLAVPMHWGGELRGVLTVGYKRPFEVTEHHLALLEAFGELAAVACMNASAHAGLVLAARTDGLTGCLNHAALHESLGREIERSERAPGATLSLIMIDLDDFKAVNDDHGHLVGDEVLRRAGHSLRQSTRPYDIAARYGGDEFALLAVDADEDEAREIARRAIEQITTAIGDLCEGNAGRATAGVAQWRPGTSGVELISDADRALLFGKHEDGRGRTVPLSFVPDWFRPGRFARRPQRDAAPPVPPQPAVAAGSTSAVWPDGPRPVEQRLRDRTQALARTAALGAELTALVDDPARMLETAAAGLAEVLAARSCTIFRVAGDEELTTVAGERSDDGVALELAARCLNERRWVLFADARARARLAVQLRVGELEWGAVTVAADKPGALDEDDLHLAASVAALIGAALGAGDRHAVALAAAVRPTSA